MEDYSNFDSLLNDILENPELIMQKDFSQEQLLKIQKKLNPYSNIACAPIINEQRKVVACSYTNLREDYLKRLTMTSLVGFLYQMYNEWEVDPIHRRWIPESKKIDAAKSTYFEIDKLVERMECMLDITKSAQLANNEAIAARTELNDTQLVANMNSSPMDPEKVFALNNAVVELETKAAGLLYASTHMVMMTGKEANDRLPSTVEHVSQFPEVKEVFKQYPPPIVSQLELPEKQGKAILKDFLDQFLKFDPSKHVKNGSSSETIKAEVITINGTDVIIDTADPGHLPLQTVFATAPKASDEHKEALSIILQNQRTYTAACTILRDEDLIDSMVIAIADLNQFKHYLFPVASTSDAATAQSVPPQDTFHRWNYYTEVNYEELRTITEAIYPERSDLDWAIGIWNTFEGTSDEIKDAFDKYCQKYQEEFPSSVKALEIGGWSLLADFKENRKKIEFYNRNTEVLKRILDRHTEDKKLGAELMKNRIRQVKAKNIAEDGPDAQGLTKYRNDSNGSNLPGAEKVISNREMLNLEKAKGNIKAAQELEHVEKLEEQINILTSTKKLRELTNIEQTDLNNALRTIELARQMAEVPKDAIQIDVFTNDTTDGGQFMKSSFYTKSEELVESHYK